MEIKPGMFVKICGCTIYFEVEQVFSNMVTHASRDPSKKTELTFISDLERAVETPLSSNWIKLDREKGFYDKFYPEGWTRFESEVVAFNKLQAGDILISTKGHSTLIKKISENKWKLSGKQKTLSGSDGYVQIIKQFGGPPVHCAP